MKVFLFDNANNKVIINEPEVLLIKEFAALWTNERNKTKEDPKGIYKSRAYRELTYIWLMIYWASPYSDYAEQDRHQACLQDANLSEDEWADPVFRAACRKYRDMQNESRALKLIKAAQGVVDKITDYFDTIDLSERDPITGRPIWKTNDVMKEMQSVSKVVDELKSLEYMYKKEQEEETGVRGEGDIGHFDR